MKKTVLSVILLLSASSAQATYYCEFDCLLLNPDYTWINSAFGGNGPSLLIKDETLVRSSGATDFEAYSNVWQECQNAFPEGQKGMAVKGSMVREGNILYAVTDAAPRYCEKARE